MCLTVKEFMYIKELEAAAKIAEAKKPIVETKPKIKYESNKEVIKTLLRLDN